MKNRVIIVTSQEIEQLTKQAVEFSALLQKLHKEISTVIVGPDNL